MSISAARASPLTKRHIILFIQSTPGRKRQSEGEIRREIICCKKSPGQRAADFTFSAGRALAAALVLVEFNQPGDGSDHVGLLKRKRNVDLTNVLTFLRRRGVETHRFVHDDQSGGAQAGLGLDEAVKVHQYVRAHALGDEGGGRAAGDDAQQVVPAAAHST